MLQEGLSTDKSELRSEVQQLLQDFDDVFLEPKALPPHHVLDHEIHLLPNSIPINVKPYRYPHFQKEEIEKQEADILETCIIRPSTSPFSSPIFLGKKKDGTWRFCIDYRGLNNIIV